MTSISRRAVVIGALAPLAAGSTPLAAETAPYPDRPVRIVVPFGAGGLADVTIRIVGEKASALLGQQIVVVNQPGANGVTAAKAVLAAPADGYTLALLTNGTAVAAALARQPAFDALKDFMPISGLGTFDFVFLASGKGPFASLADILAEARKNPGKLNLGTISIGSSQNLSAILFKALTGIDATIVPFRTTPDVLTAVIRDDVHLAIDGYSAAKSLIADGQLRALATSGAKRSEALPAIQTVAEAGVPGFEVTSWNAVFARVGTPPAVVDALHGAIGRALADAGIRSRLLDLGIEPAAGSPAEAGARLAADIAKWNAIIDKAGIVRQ